MNLAGDLDKIRVSIRQSPRGGLQGKLLLDRNFIPNVPRVIVNGFPEKVDDRTVQLRGRASRNSYLGLKHEVFVVVKFEILNNRIEGLSAATLDGRVVFTDRDDEIFAFIEEVVSRVMEFYLVGKLSYPEAVYRVIRGN